MMAAIANFAIKRGCHSTIPFIAVPRNNCLAQRRFSEQSPKLLGSAPAIRKSSALPCECGSTLGIYSGATLLSCRPNRTECQAILTTGKRATSARSNYGFECCSASPNAGLATLDFLRLVQGQIPRLTASLCRRPGVERDCWLPAISEAGCPASLQFSVLIHLIEGVFGQRLACQHSQGVAVLAKADDFFVKHNPTRRVEPCRQIGFSNGTLST